MKSRHDKTVVSTTLIDPLEQRLLYSADHPLGLAVALGDDSGFQDMLQGDHQAALALASSMEQTSQPDFTAVAFVDSAVSDSATLTSVLENQGVKVHAIDSNGDGIAQVSDYLQEYSNLDSVMIFSHAADAGFSLGASNVNIDSLSLVENQVAAWGQSMSEDADLLLFGCSLADDEDGQQLLGRLATLTRADVAASEDTTGHIDRGGDWDLEWRYGSVDTAFLDDALLDDWQGSLNSIVVTTQLDIVDAPNLSTLVALQENLGTDNAISLREAVLVANNDATVSLIQLAADTTYLLTIGTGESAEDAGLKGDLDMTRNYSLAGGNTSTTIIDQQADERVVHILAGANISLSDLTLTGGNEDEEGGGLRVESGAVASLDSVVVRNNHTQKSGGGVSNDGTLTAQDTTIAWNTSADNGGGIHNSKIIDLERVTINNNVAVAEGGGFFFRGPPNTATLDYVTISGNSAKIGGAIDTNRDMQIQNSTIVLNSDEDETGGIRVSGGGDVEMMNTVVADNTSQNGNVNEQQVSGSIISLGYNFIEDPYVNAVLDTDIVATDPMLAALASNGGKVQTHAVLAGSPLINRGGSTSTLVDANGSTIDQIPDIGAYESEVSSGVLFWTDGTGSIFRSDAAGGNVQTLLTGIGVTVDLEVDIDSERIYWLENTGDFNSAAFDGSDVQTHFNTARNIYGFGLDVAAGHVYMSFRDFPLHGVARYDLSNGTYADIASAATPTDAEFDVGAGLVYWLEVPIPVINATSLSSYDVATDDSNSLNLSTISDISIPSSLVLNSAGDRMYWVDSESVSGQGILGVADTSMAAIVSSVFVPETVHGVAFDSLSNRVFIATGSDGRIISYDDTLGDMQVVHSALGNATSIAIIATTGSGPNEAPTFTSAASFGVAENTTTVGTVTTTDVDAGTPQYSLIGTTDDTLFSVDINTGQLSFNTVPDFETPTDAGGDNVYDVTVQVEDGLGGIRTQNIAITVNNVNEAPTFTSAASFGVAENTTTVGTVTTTDVDAGTPQYTLIGSTDDTLFSVDINSGQLNFNTAPDFETPTDAGGNNVYDVTVQVDDGLGGVATQNIAITVNNVNEAPTFTSAASFGVAENTTTVGTVTTTDVDAGTAQYTLIGTTDDTLFSVDINTGQLSFNTAPDFETRADVGGNNVYDVTVQVDDGLGGVATQNIAITVNNVNEAPTFTSAASFGVAENTTTVGTVTTTDVDVGTAQYTLIGSTDDTLFSVDINTGQLSFNTAPDFETPTDAGGNNVYDVTVQVDDGWSGVATQNIAITVNNVNEAPVLLNNGLSLNEGQTKVLTTTELNVTDVDTAPADIHYTVSNMPASGAVFVAGVEQLTFTQENLNNGEVAYRNDGSHTGFETSWAETFEFSVSDGDNTISNETFTLTINDVPGAPVMQANNGLSLDEGDIKVITASVLNVTDVDTSPSAIIYTATAHPAGGKVLVGGVEQLTFTQEDLNNGDVAYQDAGTHEGFEITWTQSFDFSVTDSVHSIYSQSFVMTIADVPDPLVLQANNSLSLDEGEIKILTPSELNVTDVDTAPSAIVYTASSHPAGGKMLVGGVELLTFTQEDLNNGEVAYRDNGSHAGFESSWTESFQFSITDGTTSIDNQTFILTVNDVPDAPVFSPSVGVSLQEGSLMTLTAAHLTVTDADTVSDEIIYTVTASNSGQLLVGGSVADTFSQADLIDGRVAFQHDGSEPSVVSSVSFNVSDGSTFLPEDTLVFTILPVHDEAPVAMDHDLSGNRGELMFELQTGSQTLLDGVSDIDEPTGTLLVSLDTAASNGTVFINSDGTFSYLHDGTETFSDSFTYTVTDEGGNTSSPAVVTIVVSGNTTPVTNGSVDSQTAIEMQVFTLTLDSNLFSDTADDSLVWQASRLDGSDLPQWLSFDSFKRTFSGTPGDADTGDVKLRVQAFDTQGAESAPIQFTLTVNDVNQAPFLSVESQSTIQENQLGAAITTISASDPDLTDKVTVSVNDSRFQIRENLLSLKPGESLDHESEPEILLTITATDESGETVDRLLTVQVQDGNDVPVLATDTQDIVLERDTVTFIPADWFFDEDGDPLTYTWKLASGADLPDWIMFDQQGSTLSLGQIPDDESTQSVVLTASDGRGGVAQLFLDLQLPLPVIAPAIPVVEPTPVEPQAEVVLSTFDLDVLPSDNSIGNVGVSKDGLVSDNSSKNGENTSVAALGVSASRIIPLIVDVDPVSSEDLSERIQSIKDTRVISDQIGDAFKSKRVDLSKPSTPDVFNSAINLNDIFSSVQRQDTQTLSELEREFQKQREEMESREKFNTAVVGSSITLSSGLSVGYLIYLIRGGAIVSSMLSSLPAWRFVDPLPILSSMDGGLDTDGETLASIVSQDTAR